MKRIKIFISSVQSEFAEERAMLCHYIRTDVLLGKFFEPFIFEEVPANEYSTSNIYLKEVELSQFYGNVVEKPMPAYQIYRGDVFELVDQATSFVMSRINNWVGTRAGGEKADIPTRPELPIDAVKEAIVNAVCHRDYTSNASVQIMLFRNRLEVWNPGVLPYGLTVQKLHSPHKSLPTNPLLADPMYWNGYIEKVGTGTEDIIKKCREYGLKSPEFYQEEDFRVVVWRTDNEDDDPMRSNDDPTAFQSVPTNEKRLLEMIKDTPSISRAELSKLLNISERQVRKIIDQWRNKGVLTREGGNSGKWIVNKV